LLVVVSRSLLRHLLLRLQLLRLLRLLLRLQLLRLLLPLRLLLLLRLQNNQLLVADYL
jgi:hypothetical protein